MNVTTVEFSNSNKIDKKYMDVYARLQRLAKSYYDAELTYKAFKDNPSRSEKALIGLLQKNNPMTLKYKLFFAVSVDQQIVGFAQVDCKKALTLSEKDRLKSLIEVLLVHSIKSSRKLKQLNEKLHRQDAVTEMPSDNVIAFPKPYRLKHLSGYSSSVDKYKLESHKKALLNLTLPSLIHCRKPLESAKMARELHDLSDRFAFLPLSDIDINSLQNQGLNSLGPVTLFVPEIAKLTSEQQQVILQFYQTVNRTKESPVLIMASQHPRFILQESGTIDPEILIRQSTVTLNMTKPLSHYQKRGLVDFVVNSMQRHTIN